MNTLNNHHHNQEQLSKKYTFKDFLPLIIIFLIIISFTLIRQWYMGWNFHNAMYDFMAAFFIIFGSFKIINWSGFADAYAIYDIIAKRSKAYAYIYPLIELFLGITYLIRWNLFVINIITLLVMIISSIGVAIELSKKRAIPCACLGVVFKLPMTYVTLTEDLLMAVMALIMLFI